MNKETIIKLLEKYWNCDTTREEEKLLHEFFSQDQELIPEDLRKYKTLFCWKEKQTAIKTDKKFKTEFNRPFADRFYQSMKVAATVLILLAVGIGVHTHYQQEKWMEKNFTETYTDPEDALRETTRVIGKVSSVLNMGEKEISEEMPTDSLSTSKIMTE